MNTQAAEAQQTTAHLVWDAVLSLAAEERSISRQVLRDVTGLALSIIDDHVERLIQRDKLRKVGKGLLEVVQRFRESRPFCLIDLPNGELKVEIGDDLLELTPNEAMRLGRSLMGRARALDDLEDSNKALIRVSELAYRVRQLEQQNRALKQVRCDKQAALAIEG